MGSIESDKVIRFLNEKWLGRPCPMCGVGRWSIDQSIFQLMEYNNGGIVIGGPVIPIIPVTCTNCGNTVLVNALVANALKNPPMPEEEKK